MGEMKNMVSASNHIFSTISSAALLGLAALDAVARIAGAAFGMDGGHRRRRMLRRAAQISPIDIWAQVFAANSAGGCPFYRGAMVRRQPSSPISPKTHSLNRNTKDARKLRRTSAASYSLFQIFHSQNSTLVETKRSTTVFLWRSTDV